jgi:Family of unknown function (DUF5683)
MAYTFGQDSLAFQTSKMRTDVAEYSNSSADSLIKIETKIDTNRRSQIKKIVFGTQDAFAKAFGNGSKHVKDLPKIAFVRSMILPGWGQITNHQYYKLPVVYGSAAAGIYYIIKNRASFIEYNGHLSNMVVNGLKEMTIIDKDKKVERGPYSLSVINTAATTYQRWTQGTIIGFSVGWLLFAVEANVAAHMKSFDVSDDISLQIKPALFNPRGGLLCGVGIDLNFK